MKRFHILVCSFAMVAMFFASDLMAQRGGFMRMMGGGVQLDSSLLAMKEVQKELEFTEDQTEKIGAKASELNDALRSEMREIMQGGGDMSEVEDVIAELKEEEKEILALLNDDQMARLTQLRYQRMGTAMYSDKDVQEALGLSDDQKQTIADAVEDNQQEMQDAMEEARDSGDFGSIRGIMTDLQKKLTESVTAALTDDQKEMVTEMKGEEFEFPQPQRRRRGRSDF